MAEIKVDVWLYGKLARFGKEAGQGSYANFQMSVLPECTIQDLLDQLEMPTEERGITFINGELSAMPRQQPDLHRCLQDGDRVAFFDLLSMWPFQYRHGAKITEEMQAAEQERGLHN